MIRIRILLVFGLVLLYEEDIFGLDVQWGFGGKVGYGFVGAVLTEHESEGGGLSGSLTGGGFFNFSHVDFVKIQIEVLYIQKGFSRTSYKANIEGLSFPMLVRVQMPFGLLFNSGIGITYLASGTIQDTQNEKKPEFDDYFEHFEYDWIISIGWILEVVEKLNIILEVRFSYTLNNISLRYPQKLQHYTIHPYIGIEF